VRLGVGELGELSPALAGSREPKPVHDATLPSPGRYMRRRSRSLSPPQMPCFS
jgi:hypothetical protein